MEKMLTTHHLETFEMEIETLNGTYLVSCTPIMDKQGNLQKIIHIATDITERKQAQLELEQHRKHLQEMVDQRTAELRKMVTAMAGRETRMAQLKDIIRQLRHQLEAAGITPLADDPALYAWQPEQEIGLE